MPQHIKPSGALSLKTSHALYANLSKFLVFGSEDKELVGNTSLTVAGADVVTDADIGSARAFVTGASVTETMPLPESCTILLITAGRGTRSSGLGSNATFIGFASSGNDCSLGYDSGSGGRFIAKRRGNYGGYRDLYGTSFANDAAFNTGLAVASTHSAAEIMKTCVNGTISGTTQAGSTLAFSVNPFNVPVGTPIGASANFPIGGIAIFNRVLTDQELIDVTTAPWDLLQQPPSITNIDTDNTVNQNQQNAVITLSNVPASVASVIAKLGASYGAATSLTGVTWNGNQTVTVDIPANLAAGAGQNLYVDYTE